MFKIVCLYQIRPDPGFILSTSPQKGAITLKVSLWGAFCDTRGKGRGLYWLEGASNERRPFAFTLREGRQKKGDH